ncbi:succinate dehydrogenase, cytochrome b556 subunit [Phaeovulum sp.]|uniref:succinate dehydrogenase, cytochrome b556 subunit n=1 Tax=Phaeovulum sp. TaxID=2934796 RepID=UPI00356880F8
MADSNRVDRPLSPHLTTYRIIFRPQITSFSSIMIRVTGIGMMFGVLLAVWWLLAAAIGPEAFATANAVATSWFGDLVFTLSLLAVWYHYLGGLRHLLWDTAKGLDLRTAELLGWVCVIGSVVLTILTLIVI